MSDDEPRNRRNITVPQSVNEKLSQDHINASGLISDLLQAYFAYGDIEEAAEFTADHREQSLEEQLKDSLDALEGADADPANPAVLRQASKLEIPPEDMAGLLAEYRETGEVDV